MDKFAVMMAELVAKYNQTYRARKSVMAEMRKVSTQETGKEWPKRDDSEWYLRMKVDRLCPEHKFHRSPFFAMKNEEGYWVESKYFTSKQAKAKELAKHEERMSKFYEDKYEHYYTTPEQVMAEIEAIQAKPVHPFAKQVLAYGRLVKRQAILTQQKSSLRESIKQMNKMKLGIKINFHKHNSIDCIESVTVGERHYSPKEFINNTIFEATCLG